MEIESLSRRQSSLSLDRALSVYPTSSPPPTNLRLSLLLALLVLEAVRCCHDDHCATLSSTSTFTPPSRAPPLLPPPTHSSSSNTASPPMNLSPSPASDCSATVPAPLLATQQPIQQPHRVYLISLTTCC